MYEIGKRIKQLREAKGLTMRELGKLAHLSHSFIGDIESGRSNPSLDTLQSLSKVFGVPVPELLRGTFSTENLYSEDKNTWQEMNEVLSQLSIETLQKTYSQIESLKAAMKEDQGDLDADIHAQVIGVLNKTLEPLLAQEKSILETIFEYWSSMKSDLGNKDKEAEELITKAVTNHFPRLLPKLMSLKEASVSVSSAAEHQATYSAKNLWGEPRPGVLAMLTEPLQKLYREMLAMPESPFAAFRMTGDAEVTDEMIASLVGFYAKAREQAQAMKKQSKTKNETEG